MISISTISGTINFSLAGLKFDLLSRQLQPLCPRNPLLRLSAITTDTFSSIPQPTDTSKFPTLGGPGAKVGIVFGAIIIGTFDFFAGIVFLIRRSKTLETLF